MNVGGAIEELVRKRKDLSNKKFATLIGVSEPTLYKIFKSEDGDRISLVVAKKICEVLNVSYDFLFEGKEESSIYQNASGTGNIAGNSNKQKVTIGPKSAKQETGMSLDDLMVELKLCYSKCDGLERELDVTKNLVITQNKLIETLSRQRN